MKPEELPAAVLVMLQRGREELARIEREARREKEQRERTEAENRERRFEPIAAGVVAAFPQVLHPFLNLDFENFSRYDEDHTVYLNVPGLARIAAGFSSEGKLGSAGFLVAQPVLWEDEDDGWTVSYPEVWPASRQSCRSWEAFPSVVQALAAAEAAEAKADELRARIPEKNRERNNRRERADKEYEREPTPAEELHMALIRFLNLGDRS